MNDDPGKAFYNKILIAHTCLLEAIELINEHPEAVVDHNLLTTSCVTASESLTAAARSVRRKREA